MSSLTMNVPEQHIGDWQAFLAEVDFLQEGVPEWYAQYYCDYEDLDDDRYNDWQNNTPSMTDGVLQDGLEHMEEYQQHLNRTEFAHTNLVSECESCPEQEPFSEGAPVHCTYTQVSIPYDVLPENKTGEPYKLDELVAMIIGKDGYYLNQITEEYGLHYIWYEANPFGVEDPTIDDGRFELWGRQDRLQPAVDALTEHIQNTINDISQNWNFMIGDEGSLLPNKTFNYGLLKEVQNFYYDDMIIDIKAYGLLQVRNRNTGNILLDGNEPWFLIEHISKEKFYLDTHTNWFNRNDQNFMYRWVAFNTNRF